jgi:D-glycero-D-manno-heptose 1,7-bisphosphate phosphatase
VDDLSRAAIFLDRDGTLNTRPAPHDYVRSAEDFEWMPGAAEGAARLAAAGFRLLVVSNQRGVARGLVELRTLSEIERIIQSGLAERGARIEAFRYCIHDLHAACDCRKPQPGLLRRLAAELELDLGRSWMVGDSPSDVGAGKAAGCATALIGEPDCVPRSGTAPDLVAPSLLAASELIASGRERAGGRIESRRAVAPQRLGADGSLAAANSSTRAK